MSKFIKGGLVMAHWLAERKDVPERRSSIERMRGELDRLFDNFFDGFLSDWGILPTTTTWSPRVEMVDKGDNIVVNAELPGVNPKDVDIKVTSDGVTIRGETKKEEETKEEDYYRCERFYGKFSRSLSLPVGIDTSKVKASYRDGILRLVLPKVEKEKEKSIKVEVEEEK